MSVSILSAPLPDAGQGCTRLTIPEGLTLQQMVEQVLPGMPEAEYGSLRISLVSAKGISVVDEQYWRSVCPRDGIQVVIRVVPGKLNLRTVLLVVISIAAIAFAPAVAGAFGITSALGVSLVAAGLNIIGTLLLNALIPLPSAGGADGERKDTFQISGLRNTVRRGQPVPLVLGKFRYSPPFGAISYTEIVGDQQYVRALFCFGYGRLDLDDFRLGDTSLADYSDVTIEVREGVEGDLPLSLYPNQVIEEPTNIELTRPLQRDDAGELVIVAGLYVPIETPVRRFTAADAESASVIIGFSGGLFVVNKKGRLRTATVVIRIRQRLEGATGWSDVISLNISARDRSTFFRQHSWKLPSRGRWQVEITRMTDENTSTSISDRSFLSAIQSIRPEYPINFNKPLALVALRIRATHQLNGSLDNFNAVCTRYAPSWDGTAWADAPSRNPASAYLQALTGPSNPFPVTDGEIDYDQIAAWFDFCTSKGLKYDLPHDAGETLGEMLVKVCGAGRASPRHDGIKWGVVIDRPDTLVVDHINPRNSSGFSWNRQYFDPPSGFRVKFSDETNGYQMAERIVPWPGNAGSTKPAETLNLLGKTDPAEIWTETRRRMYELMHRSDTYTAIQEGAVRVTTRGDLVVGSFDTLSRSQIASRVKEVSGQIVVLDEMVSIAPGLEYAIRFRLFDDPLDTIGTSVMRDVSGRFGEVNALVLLSSGAIPAKGDLVHFGEKATESIALKIRGVEAGESFSSILNMVPAAPEIDALTDADVPPAWNGRVGAEINLAVVIPVAPRFTLIATGAEGTGNVDHISALLSIGSGSAALVEQFQVEHRLLGDTLWVVVLVPVSEGGALIESYISGDVVELRALAQTSDGTEGPYTPVVSVEIGADDDPIPQALDASSIMVSGRLGNALVSAAIGATNPPDQIQLYRLPAGDVLNRSLHAAGAPFAAGPGTTATYVDGDGTRATIVGNGAFADITIWAADANWTISDGKASHFVGVGDNISQSLAFVSGKFYRIAYSVTGRTAGTITPQLSGGSNRDGTAASADGLTLDRIQAVTGNNTIGFIASAAFDGAIDDVTVFEETTVSVDAGLYDYYLEPQTVEGVPGPVSGPFSTQII